MTKPKAVAPDGVEGEDRRAPEDEQPIAMAIAEEAGTLPDQDRRHPDDVDLIAQLQEQLLAAHRTIEANGSDAIANSQIASALWNYFGIRTADDVIELHTTLGSIDQETPAILAASGVGSVFTKSTNGWRLNYVTPSGAALHVSGPTMAEALAAHGVHITHDSNGIEHASVTGPQHDTVIE